MNVFDLCAKLTLDKSEYESGLSSASSMISKIGGGIASGVKTMATATVGAVTAGATAVGALTKQAVDAYSNYEQLVGGVQKLFGTSAWTVEEYAQQQGKAVSEVEDEFYSLSRAQIEVFKNSSEAYKTAGMSANEYMETVTSFSASLIKSLDGDTEKSAEYADRAIRDMSDNANTFGTDISLIQNAYQGFAKENYTMLDNLKLGYGGTKEGMQDLIKDASELTDVQKELGVTVDADSLSYANIVNAIHVMQDSMNIAGTTEREAMGTIEGSMNMLKASWQNILTDVAAGQGNLDEYIDDFVVSIKAVAENVMPVAEHALSSIGYLVKQLAPVLAEAIPTIVNDVLPELVEAGASLVGTLIDTILENAGSMADTAVTLIDKLIKGLTDAVGNLKGSGSNIVEKIAKFIDENAPKLIKDSAELIKQIGVGLGEALPDLIPTVIDIILGLAEDLVDNADKIIDGAVALIVGLANGLIKSLPKLVEKAPAIIEKLARSLTESAPNILAGALSIILELGNAIVKCIPQMMFAIPRIMSALVSGITDGVSEMMEAGANLVDGLWDGITQKWSDMKENVLHLGRNLIQEFKNVFGIASPSKVFRKIGEYCVEGLQEGSDDMFGDGGLTATVSANVADKTTGSNDILELLESYLPSIANGQNIYLDGDTLVSNTAKRMDIALGKMSLRRV